MLSNVVFNPERKSTTGFRINPDFVKADFQLEYLCTVYTPLKQGHDRLYRWFGNHEISIDGMVVMTACTGSCMQLDIYE